MAIDNHFLLKKVLQKEQLIAAFSATTNMPFVYCDPVSFEDQVWLFSDEAGFREFAERFNGKKIQLRGMAVKKNSFPGFFASLLPIGITEIVFTENGASAVIPLDQFVKRQDMSKVPVYRRPLENPSLQLTSLYLMQEARRQVPNDEKEDLPALNEEFVANLARARFLMPVEIRNAQGDEKQGQLGFINITLKNGDVYRPIFGDAFEFNKFKKDKNFQSVMLPFAALKQAMPKDVKGYLLNPAGCSVVINSALIDQVLKNFPEEVNKGAEESRKIQEEQVKAQKQAHGAPLASNAGKVRRSADDSQAPHSKITKMPLKSE